MVSSLKTSHGGGAFGCKLTVIAISSIQLLYDTFLTLFSNLPIGALVLILLSVFLDIKVRDNENRIKPLKDKLNSMDPLGCFIFMATICSLLLALEWGGQSKPWDSPTVIGLLVGFVALTCLFIYLQWKRQDQALIPLRVFRKRSIFTSAMVLFFLGASSYLVTVFSDLLGVRGADLNFRMHSSCHSISRPYGALIRRAVARTIYQF